MIMILISSIHDPCQKEANKAIGAREDFLVSIILSINDKLYL